MLVNVNTVLTQLNGDPVMDMDGKGNAVEATVKMALVNAVLSPVQTDKPMDKFRKDELARKIYNTDGEVELTAEEVVLLKDRVGESYAPIIVGQVWRLLENKL
jgi:hypothetical protein